MKLFSHIFLVATCLSCHFVVQAQVSCEPVFPHTDDNVTIYFTATEGNGALNNVSPVYAHMGVITNASTSSSDWKHVTTTWGIADAVGQMTQVSPNLWKKTFNIRSFFSIPANETVLKLAFVFRNTNGSIVGRAADGGDIFYNVYPDDGALLTTFIAPTAAAFLSSEGQQIPVKGASSLVADLSLYDNGALRYQTNGQNLETTITAGAAGTHLVEMVAKTASLQDTIHFSYTVAGPVQIQDPPSGTTPGIYPLSNNSIRLALYAPNKQIVYVIGDFNNWQPEPNYQMKQSVDGNLWWLDITGLSPGQMYRFQYFVDGSLKIADPLSTLVLDPWNDGFIPAITYPNLPPYPVSKTSGFVSLVQTDPPAFNWMVTSFQKPAKTDLVVYELLIRDFLARHDYATLLDTLDYLQDLGVNCIELMPVSEFDGNLSWGYNPSFHKALDKYYGSPEDFKKLVDACHQRNIAVVLDVVFNQASNSSPLAQLYWNAASNRPAADNPWLNPTAPHDYSVFNDFNHESPATQFYVKNCLQYWLSEYHVDGFRFDLSKGFTQKNTLGNVGAWGQYDASRIAILTDYANAIWALDPNAYVILEHFADNTEETELASRGMMLWGNMSGAYQEVALGFVNGLNTDLSWLSYKKRGWAAPHSIGYMESHDEERIAYRCLQEGNSSNPNYNIKSAPVAMSRMETLENLFYTVPGPKMLWEFGELGYDYPINYCEDGTIDNGCRTGPKPIRWDYLDDPYRKHLHDVSKALIHLRTEYDVFETTDFELSFGSGKIRKILLHGSDMNALVVVNIANSAESALIDLHPDKKWWYEYYSGDSTQAGPAALPVSFKPGEYRIYTDQYVPLPAGLQFGPLPEPPTGKGLEAVLVYPNPLVGTSSLQFHVGATLNIQLEVYDIMGRQIISSALGSFTPGTYTLPLVTSNWQPGVYWLNLSDENGNKSRIKLLKLSY